MAKEKGSKRKAALKTAGRIAGAFGTIALGTSAIPAAANAAKAVKAAETTKEVAGGADALKTVGTLIAGGAIALIGKGLVSGGGESGNEITENKIASVFPGALPNKKLVSAVSDALETYGYGSTTLVATSLCADEVNRVLEKDFMEKYDYNFHMGGLAGFPFGGVTSFGAMAAHIPDGGSCLVVFGPHVGVDSTGKVGTVERRGRANGGSCCGSAIAASGYVASVSGGDAKKADPPKVPLDAQQNFVGNMLLPYADRLEKASDKMVELPYALYDAQKKMMSDIVKAAGGNVAGNGKIAVLGGIQINTPEGTSDYFKPMSFEVFDNSGKLVSDLTGKL